VAGRGTERRLTAAQLAELLPLLEHVDAVELKLTLPESIHRSAIGALGLDPIDAHIRQVYFLDTPDLQLDEAGIFVRLRRVQGRDDDTVIKLRPADPASFSSKDRDSPGFSVELDAMPGGFVCSASFRGDLPAGRVLETLRQGRAMRKLFSKGQRRFFEAHAPAAVALDDLVALGPILVLKLRFPGVEGRRFAAELWLYPNGARVLELSTRCRPDEAVAAARKTRDYLASRGIDQRGDQETKTRTALRALALEVRATS